MSSNAMNAMFDELGKLMGMKGLVFDDQHSCHLLIENQHLLTLHYDSLRERLTLVGRLSGTLPETVSNDWLKSALNASLNPMIECNPGVGWAPDVGLVCFKHMSVIGLSAQDLVEHLGNFLEWMNSFLQQLIAAETLLPNDMSIQYDRL